MKISLRVWGILLLSILLAVSLVACGDNGGGDDSDGDETATFTLNSTAFDNDGTIPVKYTCDGDDISPPLSWANQPQGTKSFVLIMDDIDAGNFTHWVSYDIPSTVSEFSEGSVPVGIKQGLNDFGNTGYGGPCPPSGTHRYRFRLYALYADTLGLTDGASRQDVENAMQGNVLGTGILIGKYSR